MLGIPGERPPRVPFAGRCPPPVARGRRIQAIAMGANPVDPYSASANAFQTRQNAGVTLKKCGAGSLVPINIYY